MPDQANIFEAFLARFSDWVRLQPDILGAGLVGSRVTERDSTSDVDLIILTPDPDRYLLDHEWIALFGDVVRSGVEQRDMVSSLRVFYHHGLEVEYGIATPDWAAEPIDVVTRAIVGKGMRILHDPRQLLALVQAVSRKV